MKARRLPCVAVVVLACVLGCSRTGSFAERWSKDSAETARAAPSASCLAPDDLPLLRGRADAFSGKPPALVCHDPRMTDSSEVFARGKDGALLYAQFPGGSLRRATPVTA